MKRDARLQGLSSDHHQAMVLARDVRMKLEEGSDDAALAARVVELFEREIEPHFLVEDEVLLPALREAGATALVTRTEEDHAFLRTAIAQMKAGKGDRAVLGDFSRRMFDHVRFEEAELFPRCEASFSDEVLGEVARRAPHPR
jgi:hemerythrin-like domain-containing protein